MIRKGYTPVFSETSWPRTSGDDPDQAYRVWRLGLLAPHERG